MGRNELPRSKHPNSCQYSKSLSTSVGYASNIVSEPSLPAIYNQHIAEMLYNVIVSEPSLPAIYNRRAAEGNRAAIVSEPSLPAIYN